LACRQGYLPDAMINYLALLGWNDGTDKDIYTRQELIDSFDLNRVTASPAQFDQVCQCVECCVRVCAFCVQKHSVCVGAQVFKG
jgi:hypothetical protein